jgi:hypothetical protein
VEPIKSELQQSPSSKKIIAPIDLNNPIVLENDFM